MVSLLSRNACLEAEKEAAMKQAQSASRAAETLMSGSDGDKELKEKLTQKESGNLLMIIGSPKPNTIIQYQTPQFFYSYYCKLNVEMFIELSKALKDVASMKAQAENLSAEYDRLCDEKNSLERKLAIQGTGDKKDD